MTNPSLYLRRRGRVGPPDPVDAPPLPLAVATSLSIELEELGYALSPAIVEACRRTSVEALVAFRRDLVAALTKMVGVDHWYRPMYANFPREVMEASEAELYLNAIVHYWSAGQLFPAQRKKLRLRLQEPPRLKFIELGTTEEFEGLFGQIVGANAALSGQDREDLEWFVRAHGDGIERLLPETVPQKENAATLAALLIRETGIGVAFARRTVRTATDVLRLAVALGGGDVSLATPTKFGRLSRPQRRLLLELLEDRPYLIEDMLRRKSRWKRLGERLHPGEMAARFPNAAHAFDVLRNDRPAETFNGRVETALARGEVAPAVDELARRPGDFARRLDHVLRLDPEGGGATLERFRAVAERVSTPVVLQAWHHFATRDEAREFRVFFPKGNVAKSHAEPNRLPPLARSAEVADVLRAALRARFAALPPLGRTYVDPALRDYPMPFATRSASKALRTLPRGSRVPLPDADTLRMFLWWRNGRGRTDIDLSAALFGEGFLYLDVLAYYNLQGYGGVHSGDIVDAPEGASEFIDVSVARLRELGVRYVAMVLNSYTQHPYVDLPECFAGWMARARPESGEIYEPRTVQDRLDLTADTRVAIPIVFDLVAPRAIWCDMALRHEPSFPNNVAGNLTGIALTLRTMAELSKPTLYDLFALHAEARGGLAGSPDGAESAFSVAAGTPYELERIASEFMG